MSALLTEAAELSWLVRAVSRTMTFLIADAASASEGTIDFGIGAIRLVMADFSTVVAFTSHLAGLGAVTREVAGLATAGG